MQIITTSKPWNSRWKNRNKSFLQGVTNNNDKIYGLYWIIPFFFCYLRYQQLFISFVDKMFVIRGKIIWKKYNSQLLLTCQVSNKRSLWRCGNGERFLTRQTTGSFRLSGLHIGRVGGWTKRLVLSSSVNPKKNASRSLNGWVVRRKKMMRRKFLKITSGKPKKLKSWRIHMEPEQIARNVLTLMSLKHSIREGKPKGIPKG